jgi:DNA-binding MarR family transcriptional regulator
MNPSQSGRPALGPALRRAWDGYQRRLDEAMAAAGFGDRGFPDGRVLRVCRAGETTISRVGRELGITRQGASKIVASLVDRRYVVLKPSADDAREKIVTLTPRAVEYLDAQRTAARRIEREIRRQVGDDAFNSLWETLEVIGGTEQPRMRDYLRHVRAGQM